MTRYIDAEKLEKDGWSASRTYQQDIKTMVYETKKMTDFPTADVVKKERYDRLLENANILAEAVRKYQTADVPERNVGKWVDDGKGLYKCTACGEFWTHWWANVVPIERMHKELRFCPNCGADMRGEENV